jgi:SRSO17 transposase
VEEGGPQSLYRRDRVHKPTSAKAIAAALPNEAWQTVTWREGTNAMLTSRLAALHVRPAHRDYRLSEPYPKERLLIEQPVGEAEPTKYWSSPFPDTASSGDLVANAKLQWRIERDYQDLKQELGLGHYKGRGWRFFPQHATLCIMAYAFLVAKRCLISPSGPGIATHLPIPAVPDEHRPSGTPAEN